MSQRAVADGERAWQTKYLDLLAKYPGREIFLKVHYLPSLFVGNYYAFLDRIASHPRVQFQWKEEAPVGSYGQMEGFGETFSGQIVPMLSMKSSTKEAYLLRISGKDYYITTSISRNQYGKEFYNVDFYIPLSEKLTNYKTIFTVFFSLVTGSNYYYTPQQKEEVMRKFNELIGSKSERADLDTSRITNLATLLFDHVRLGGIFGDQGYVVAPKADGVRTFLYLDGGAVYMIATTFFIKFDATSYKFFPNVRYPIIFEGEWLTKDSLSAKGKEINARYIVTLYDTLVFEGKDVTDQPLARRMGYYEGFTKIIVRPSDRDATRAEVEKKVPLYLTSKEAYPILTPQNLFEGVQAVANGDYIYKTDGMVFTPRGPYLEPGSTRLYKWKPFEKNSIDLLFRDGKFYEGAPRGSNTPLIERKISFEEYPFENGIVYELKPRRENDRLIWSFDRARYNRKSPNSHDVVENNLKAIRDYVSFETLTGRNLDLYRHYHRREKGDMLGFPQSGGRMTLLDLGAGRLGDLTRWRSYKKIYAVEPNAEFRRIGLERKKAMADTQDVTYLAQGAETPIEIGVQVDVISSMFSSSYFAPNEANWKRVLENIDRLLKPGGYLLVAMLDGRLVKDAFNHWQRVRAGTEGDELEGLKFPFGPQGLPKVSIYKTGSVTPFMIPLRTTIGEEETVVNAQDEYALDSSFMVEELNRIGLRLIRTWVFDQEPLLNKTELYLTRLYSGWIFQREGELSIAPPIERVKKLVTSLPSGKESRMLRADEEESMGRFYGFPASRVGVPPDGSCLIASILYLIDDPYRLSSGPSARRQMVVEERQELGRKLTDKVYKTLAISENIPYEDQKKTYTLETLKETLSNPRSFLGIEEFEYLQKYFQLNFIILRMLTIEGVPQLVLQPAFTHKINDKYDAIFIFWNGTNHYEPIVLNLGGEDIYVFNVEEPLIKLIKTKLNRRD